MSKIRLFSLILLIFSFSSFVYSQQAVSGEENQVIENSFDESSILLNDVSQSQKPLNRGSSTFSLLLRMVVFLFIVVLAIYFIFKFFKKSMATPENDDMFMRLVSTINLSPTKSISIVTLTDKYAYMIGVSDDSVNLISQIDDVELIQALNLYSDKQKNTNKPKNFEDILELFMGRGFSQSDNVLKSSKNKITDLLQKQRNKFNGGE